MGTITIKDVSFTHILDFTIATINSVQLPQWINEAESMNSDFFNGEVSVINYTVRANDSQKYALDKILRAHSTINLTDSIYGLNNTVFLTTLDDTYEFNNAILPWNIKITMIGNV